MKKKVRGKGKEIKEKMKMKKNMFDFICADLNKKRKKEPSPKTIINKKLKND